jgi:transcriptional regulator with XRE-family HTH domain
VQPHSVGKLRYRIRMQPADPKTYLWKTLVGRLGVPESTGVDAVFTLLKDSGVSRGTVQRIKERQTSVGVDQLSKLASHFKVEVWELLVPPGAVARAAPVSLGESLSEEQMEAFRAFTMVATNDERSAILERYESLKKVAASMQGHGLGGAGSNERQPDTKHKAA